MNTEFTSILPVTTTVPEHAERLYTRVRHADSERMSGSQIRYNSFADFVTTFHAEANDPNVIGAADILDVINPLQHLPLVSTLYRDMTGDTIKPGARMIGGAVFGGGMGLASASVNAVVEAETGRDLAGNMALALSGSGESFTRHQNGTRNGDSSTLALGLVGGAGTAQGDSSAKPGRPVAVDITWDSPVAPGHHGLPTSRESSRHGALAYHQASFYAERVGAVKTETGAQTSPARYTRVMMADPERTSGSFARYV